MTGQIGDIALPEPSGTGFEDCLRAALSVGGLYAEAGLKEVDAARGDLFEVDILAHDFATARSVAIEAKSGQVRAHDLWKLAGIAQYLRTNGVLITVYGAARPLLDEIQANDRLKEMQISAFEAHNCNTWQLCTDVRDGMRSLGFDLDHGTHSWSPAEFDTWRYAFWCARAITEQPVFDGLSPETTRRMKAWRKYSVENAPLTHDPIKRIDNLYRRYEEYGKDLHVEIGSELGAVSENGRLDDGCLNDGAHPAVQLQLLIGLMSRVNLFAAMVQASNCSSDELSAAAAARRLNGWRRDRMEELRNIDDAVKLPELLLRFLLCWGGFWTLEHHGAEREQLAREAGVETDLVDTMFTQLDALRLWGSGSAMTQLGDLMVCKFVPAQLRGVGLHHRLRVLDKIARSGEYIKDEYSRDLCRRWEASTVALLLNDRKPGGVTSSYLCCAAPTSVAS